MRSMPNMLISSPSSNKETKQVLNYLLKKPMPSYLRLSKNEETITNNKKTSFNFLKPGKWVKLKVGKNKKKKQLCSPETLYLH